MSLAPNYDVPADVSPFAPLPQLTLCSECKAPVEPFRTWAVVRGGHFATGLCGECAESLDRMWREA